MHALTKRESLLVFGGDCYCWLRSDTNEAVIDHRITHTDTCENWCCMQRKGDSWTVYSREYNGYTTGMCKKMVEKLIITQTKSESDKPSSGMNSFCYFSWLK